MVKDIKTVEKHGKPIESAVETKKTQLLRFLQTNNTKAFTMNDLENKHMIGVFKQTQHLNNTLNQLLRAGLIKAKRLNSKDKGGNIKELIFWYIN